VEKEAARTHGKYREEMDKSNPAGGSLNSSKSLYSTYTYDRPRTHELSNNCWLVGFALESVSRTVETFLAVYGG
jgi:hypothetical protein